MWLFLLAFCVLFTPLLWAEEMPEPYRSIKELPFDPHGWWGNEAQISRLIERIAPKIIVEVGCWLGSSTRYLASQVAPHGGVVYAIDTWLGSDEQAHQKNPRLKKLYHLFLSNVRHAGLTQTIVPIRMASQEAAKALNVTADLIYVDASHKEEDVYQDILAWYQHLRPGGIICGDDWTWPSVSKGVVRAAAQLGRKLRTEANCWWFE